jgi:hypothetical protein
MLDAAIYNPITVNVEIQYGENGVRPHGQR